MSLAVAAALVVAASAPAADPERVATSCRIRGWSVDADPRGLNVRTAPAPGAPIVGRLPAFVRDREGDHGPTVDIVGSANGWLLIENAADSYGPGGPRPTYAGRGWVHGSRIRLAVQSPQGRAGPTAAAPVVVDAGEHWLSEVAEVTGVVACRDALAEVSYRIHPRAAVTGARAARAWFGGVCGEQRTTCDRPAFRWPS